jgi:hypothetical protein
VYEAGPRLNQSVWKQECALCTENNGVAIPCGGVVVDKLLLLFYCFFLFCFGLFYFILFYFILFSENKSSHFGNVEQADSSTSLCPDQF